MLEIDDFVARAVALIDVGDGLGVGFVGIVRCIKGVGVIATTSAYERAVEMIRVEFDAAVSE